MVVRTFFIRLECIGGQHQRPANNRKMRSSMNVRSVISSLFSRILSHPKGLYEILLQNSRIPPGRKK